MTDSLWRRLNPWSGLAGLPREVWVLCSATLVNRCGTMVLPFLVLYLTRSLHLSAGTAGLVVAAYGAAALVVAPISGRLGDRVGPVRIMRASLVLTGAVLLLFHFAKTLPAIVGATVALAVVNESFRPANMAIIGDLVPPEKRRTAFSLNRLAINLGMSVGPALGGFLATVSFRSLFVVDGLTSLLAGAILVWARFPAHPHGADDAGPRPGSALGAVRDMRLLYFLLAGLLPVALIFFQHLSTMPLFLVHDLGLSEAAYGILFSVNTLLIVFLEVPLNTATARWPHRRTLLIGAALFGLGLGALGVAWDFRSVAATVVVWTFGEMFFFPGMAAYVSDLAPPERRGEYMGLAQMTMSLAFMLGPWGGTAILQHLGGRAVWGVALLLGLGAAALLSRLANGDAGTD